MTESPRDSDALLERARAAQQRADRLQQSAQGEPSAAVSRLRANPVFQRWAARLRRLLGWLGPLGSVLFWLARRLGRSVRWAAFARRDGDFLRSADGGLVFAPVRLLKVTLVTVLAGFVLHVALSAAYYYGTRFQEVVYVTGKQEIETGERYQFGGCTALPCSTVSDNGKFYLIESSLYFPTLIYPEENVFANIPQQNGACLVSGYGIYFRSLRWLYKSAQLYQHVDDVSCRPYTEAEIEQLIDSGERIQGDSPRT